MRIAYLAPAEPVKRQRSPTARQRLHQAALEAIAHERRLGRKKIETMFAAERAELKRLNEKFLSLTNKPKNENANDSI